MFVSSVCFTNLHFSVGRVGRLLRTCLASGQPGRLQLVQALQEIKDAQQALSGTSTI